MHHLLQRKISRLLPVICLLAVLQISPVAVDAQLISWNPISNGSSGLNPWTPATIDPNITSTGLVRGSSISSNGTSGCYGGPCSGGYVTSATGTSAADSKSDEFTITATCATLSLTSLNGATRRSGTGPTNFNVYYALGTATTYTYIGNYATSATSGTTGTAFSVSLSGISALQNIAAGTSVKFIFTPIYNSSAAGTWYFTSSNLSLSGTATAISAPTIVTSPTSVSIAVGTGTSFTVSGVTDAASYQWQRNTSGISGGTWVDITSATMDPTGTYSGYTTTSTATSNTLTLSNVPASWNGYGYRCMVTNCAGSTPSTGALLTVNATPCSGTPNAGSALPGTAGFCASGSTTLNLTGGSSGLGLSYQWSSSATNTPPGANITGATNAYYTTPSITATTYYWCTTTCSVSAASNISSVGTVTINPTPAVTVTPAGGNYCSAGSGLNMAASGASTYIWTPGTGLSTTTGSAVTATPAGNTTYTVTGTSAAGCTGTNTVTVNYVTSPGSLGISPLSVSACAGSATTLLTATGGLVGPSTVSSGAISLSVASPNAVQVSSLNMAGVPAGATITGASVTLNFSSNYLNDYIINLVAPNGNILNLVTQEGPHGSGSYTSTVLDASSVTALSTGSSPFTGTYAADAYPGFGPAGYVSNITVWSSLYSLLNGTWRLVAYNNSTYTNSPTTLNSWSLTLTYSYQSPVTWSPTTNLTTDAPGTLPYTGTTTNTLYENPAIAGVITYTATANNSGCTSSAVATATVTAIPTAITGNTNICTGSATSLSDAVSGGLWTSTNTAVATINAATGVVSGLTAGTTTISYTNGCGSGTATTLTVNATPVAITGTALVCSGSATTLSDATPGGTWSSGNTGIATVDPSGMVTGVGAGGTVVISYSNGCGVAATASVIVGPLPATPPAIAGTLLMCAGGTSQLSDATSGGAWSSGTTSVATISGTGLVNAVAAGASNISYTVTNGCGSAYTTALVVVNPLPTAGAITGANTVCVASTITLNDPTGTGVWSSSNTAIATAGTGGVVGGVSAGTATISYTVTTGCGTAFTTATVTVNPLPAPTAAIAGAGTTCVGSTMQLSDASAGGTWTSNNTAVATVGSAGLVGGVAIGIATITYTTGNSCGTTFNTATVTVISTPAPPAAITGNTHVCGITTLSDATTGGVWSSNNTAIATVNPSSGLVGAVSTGTTTITYTTSMACGSSYTTTTVMVDTLPAPAIITGSSTVCAGGTITLHDASIAGAWSSSNTAIATVGSATGVVTGVATGSATISYTMTSGCGNAYVTYPISVVSMLAAPSAIAGDTTVCIGSVLSLSDPTSGGTWSSANSGIAAVNSSGTVSGIATGNATISYSLTNICGTVAATAHIIVSTLPNAGNITAATDSVCPGHTITLTENAGSGAWSSDNALAIVNGSGVVTGVFEGLDSIRYTVTNSCGSSATAIQVYVLPPGSPVCNPTGVNTTPAVETALKVFPNPNPGVFTMVLSSASDEPVHVIITNLVGEKVSELTTATNKETSIKVDQAAGIYFLTANTANSTNIVKVVVAN